MRLAYSRLSATLERVVEDVILNGVIGRYRDWVHVTKLPGVVGFTVSECEQVLRLHNRASNVTERHAAAAARMDTVPSPLELSNDIAALKTLIEAVNTRRRAATAAST